MKQIYTLLFLLFLFAGNAYCQSVSAISYATLTMQQPGMLKEKLFIHTDKTFYVAGEIIWFKVYCVEASSHQPLDLSKVAYVELLDSTNKPALQAKIELRNANGDGSFRLPFSLSSGSYQLRAYTNWMKNGSADEFFEKNLTLINVQKLTVNDNKKREETASVFFFPEGGNLVNNIKTHIAFKAVDQYGKGIHCTGVLRDGKDSILSFSDHQAGIGSFYFTPIKNHVYTAQIQPENGNAFIQPLPAAKEEGYAMNVSEINSGALTITIEINGTAAQPVYLVIHKNKKPVLAKEAALQNGKGSFAVDTALLPSGVSVFTIFNAEKQPVCERLFYKNYPPVLQLTASADAATYNIRKKVNISLRTTDKNFTNDDSASLSMSVYRIDSLQTIDDNTVDSYLNLTSELHNPVENASVYLSEQNKNVSVALDELMLVSGWRKFNTGAASGTEAPILSFAPEYRAPIVTGKIINNQIHLPRKNTNVYLSLPGKGKQFYTATSDSSGIVRWETENWHGDTKLIAQTDDKDSSYTITIDDAFSHHYAAASSLPFVLPYNNPNTLLEHSIGMQAASIYSGNELNRLAVSITDSTPFFTAADKTYKLDDYSRFTTMEEVLREYIMLVNVTKKKGSYHFPVYDLSGGKMFDADPLVLVDGIPFFNLDSFITIDPLKLKKLDIVNRRYFYGNAVFDGILNWHTYDGDATDIDIDPRAVVIDYEGLQEKREFYSPTYETEVQLNSHLPDFRNVLYWNPNLSLKGNEAKQLSFFASDLPGKYVVSLQGAGSHGLVNAMTTFEVIKK